jgi:hypothetical protein
MELNERNRLFWEGQRALFQQRMTNDPIREAALSAFVCGVREEEWVISRHLFDTIAEAPNGLE